MAVGLFGASGAGLGSTAQAATDCTFTTSGSTMTLDADCTTDATILILHGFTLDGDGNTITAVDPVGGHFLGAVVKNAGTVAHVRDLRIVAANLASSCDSGDDRLRGIMFDGASGSIIGNVIAGVNEGASGCQEGNGIEVRNAPFDGTHPNTLTVEIAHNLVNDYQKTGIVANGDVLVNVHHNKVGASATQANLAANSIQLGFGASGSVVHNQIDGNSWAFSDAAATAVLVNLAGDVNISQNNIHGNVDVGIFICGAESAIVNNNKVSESGADGFYDIGIGNYPDDCLYGPGSTVTNNKVKGFDTPYDGVSGGKNKVIPGPQNFD
jgi:parallel beta-helix repeat protein